MEVLIWIGAGLSLIGVGMLLWCVRLAMSARKPGLDEAARRARLQRVLAINMGALGLSALGLMMVVVGILLT